MSEAGNEFLDAAAAHFDKMQGQKITVPADLSPTGEEVTFCFNPLSMRQRQQLNTRAGKVKGGEINQSRLLAVTVMLHTRTTDGDLFFKDTAATLAKIENKMDPRLVAHIAADIIGSDPDDGEGDLKN